MAAGETCAPVAYYIRRIRQTANRKPQFAVTRLQFRVAEISNFSKVFSSVQFIFI